MSKNLTEMVFILDRSGSMSHLEADTIGGYNSLLEKQKKEQGEAVVTTVLFDDKYELIHDHADIKKVNPLLHTQTPIFLDFFLFPWYNLEKTM